MVMTTGNHLNDFYLLFPQLGGFSFFVSVGRITSNRLRLN